MNVRALSVLRVAWAAGSGSATPLEAVARAPAAFGAPLRAFATGQSLLGAPPLRALDGQELPAAALFGGTQRVLLFGVVGAFTGTCNNEHVPAYQRAVPELKALCGVDRVVCVTVNDPHVGAAWAKALGLDQKPSDDSVQLVVDPDAAFVRSLGLDIDLSHVGLGVRSQRFAMMIENGVISMERIASNPGEVGITGPDEFLKGP